LLFRKPLKNTARTSIYQLEMYFLFYHEGTEKLFSSEIKKVRGEKNTGMGNEKQISSAHSG